MMTCIQTDARHIFELTPTLTPTTEYVGSIRECEGCEGFLRERMPWQASNWRQFRQRRVLRTLGAVGAVY